MSASPGWSNERVATLSKLWVDGLSAAEIARQLGGVTRNAVIGKLHRLGLSGRAAPSAPRRTPKPPARRRARQTARVTTTRPPRPILTVVEAVPDGPGTIVRMTDLGAHDCRWPIGDPKDAGFTFCGREAQGRYCDGHERLGARPGARWRADQDPVVKRALAGLA